RGDWFSVTVGGAGNSAGTGTGGFAGGSDTSPGGTGNFQPSVLTFSASLPTCRTQGASVKSRASRTFTDSGASKRGSGRASVESVRSTNATSTSDPLPPCGGGDQRGLRVA